jgi:hypothetical protein
MWDHNASKEMSHAHHYPYISQNGAYAALINPTLHLQDMT